VQSEIQGLTLAPNVELKEGAVKYSLYIGALSCALVMAFLTVLALIFLLKKKRKRPITSRLE
jgi:hypothetical protein